MEMHFTSSMVMAVDYAIRLAHGHLWVLPKGVTDTSAYVKVEAPIWCNFEFFSRINASPVRRTKRVEPVVVAGRIQVLGHWDLERKVEFFHHGQLVAAIDLAGMKLDDGRKGLDNSSFWTVTKICYSRSFSGGPGEPPEDWREVELGGIGMRATRMA